MIIDYEYTEFNDETKKYETVVVYVEAPEDVGISIKKSRNKEKADDARQKYNCPYSTSNLKYEGMEYADDTVDFYKETEAEVALNNEEAAERSQRVRDAFAHLSETQQRRLSLLAEGKSLREIARIEKVDIKTIRESVEGAKKKFLKFF